MWRRSVGPAQQCADAIGKVAIVGVEQCHAGVGGDNGPDHLRAGASGFLLKDTPPADLLAAIRVVAAGDALLAPGATRRLIEEFTRRPEPAPRPATALDGITEREREVLTLVGLGLSNTEIAATLHVSLSTAKTHIGRLLMKLGARDRAQLVIAAYDSGLVGTSKPT